MQVYGLYYQDIDWTLVCLFQNHPTIDDLRKVLSGEVFKPDDEYLTKVRDNKKPGDYDLRLVNVIKNGEV